MDVIISINCRIDNKLLYLIIIHLIHRRTIMINERQAHRFCRDDISKIENYEEAVNDKTQTWHIHHRLELTLDGEFALSAAQLKMHDMYYHRPYYELIFLTPTEHRRIHNIGQSEDTRNKRINSLNGHYVSDETKRKISELASKRVGEKNPWYGKLHSEESKKKMSESHKGKLKGIPKSPEQRRKMSAARKEYWIRRKAASK